MHDFSATWPKSTEVELEALVLVLGSSALGLESTMVECGTLNAQT